MLKVDPKIIEKALRKIDKYAMEDGDIGGAEWREVGQLIQVAGSMQTRIEVLEEELAHCRAQLCRSPT